MKKIIIIIAIGIALLFTVIFVRKCKGATPTEVSTEKPQNRDIIEVVSANGKIQPEVEVKISSDVSGEIVDVYVKEGQRVKKGDLLCQIKPDIYESALDRVNASVNSSKANMKNTMAQLEQAKANLVNAEAVYKRNKKLFEQSAVSQQDFDASKAQYESALATVKAAEETVKSAEFNISSAEASLKEASENLSKTKIYAPVEGTVSKLNVEKGERVQGVQGFQGTEIMRLANLNEMEVNVEVNENDIVKVKTGDTSIIEVDAYLDQKFKGIVTEIANSANTTGLTVDQVTNFTVKIRILQSSYSNLVTEKNPSPFRPGMSATVEIQTKTVASVLSVPIMAVTTRIDSTQLKRSKKERGGDESINVVDEKLEKVKKDEPKAEEVVFIVENGKAKKVIVKTGVQNSEHIQILSGLKGSEEVIVAPYSAISKKLKDGSKIKTVAKEDLFNEEK